MAKGVGLDGPILKEITMHVPAQFVALVTAGLLRRLWVRSIPRSRTTTSTPYGRQLASSQRRRESSANENDGAMFQACSHDFLPSGEVGDRFRIGSTRELLATEIDHVLGMNRRETWIANRLPEHFADIAAIDGIGKAGLLE